MIQTITKFYEEYKIGDQWTSQGRTIEMSEIVQYACHTGDFHPMTMDVEYASRSQFGGRFAAGAMTFGLVLGLIQDNNIEAFTYGHERLRYPNPVYPGDTIRVVGIVRDKREYAKEPTKWGLVEYEYTGLNQRDETVLSCRHICMVTKSPN